MTDDDIIKLQLTNCIVHLLEAFRSGHELDRIAAQNSIVHPAVQRYLENLDPALLPVPRDGAKPLTFPQ